MKVAGIPIDSSGSVQFIVSDAAVPEPSSLLALAFGGVGTAMLISRKR
ncbi:MAG: PEP-CTERM sorting domain-containing protein [Abditibacteriota bacterium]|nr:PEP-CTERM sorting domain-containing protein [Abditibacteriota bacterium]